MGGPFVVVYCLWACLYCDGRGCLGWL